MLKTSTLLRPFLYISNFLICVLPFASPAQGDLPVFGYSIEKKANGSKGAVVSAHPLASRVGLAILRRGGNAIDAAIATQLALAVVYPNAGNIGGGGFLLARLQSGKNLAIDYREKAPMAAHRDMYLDSSGQAQTQLSQSGHMAAGVPGTVAGLFSSHRYGRLPFAELIAPARELASRGFVITAAEAEGLNRQNEAFIRYNTKPTAFVKPMAWRAGDTLRQPELAATLQRISEQGSKGFYEGETARLIVEEMQRGKGLISLDDLRSYQAVERQAMSFDFMGYTILGMPLPSSGGILVEQMLKMGALRQLEKLSVHTSASVQLMVEAERRAYADRAEFLGDADFVKVPVKTLTSTAYLEERMRNYQPGQAGHSTDVKAGIIPAESEETTHLSVMDQWGNAVSVTTTLNGGYGSRTVVGGAGFLLNNEMDDFSIKPGVANMYGAVGAEANAIAPGKRMLSSMTPTIVLKKGKPFLVAGTPGGTTIPTSVFQTLVNVLLFNLTTEDAVNRPKFHHQWLPDVVLIEADFPAALADSLRTMGYKMVTRPAIGRTEVIRIDWKNKRRFRLEAVADKRGDDDAQAW